MSIFEFLLSKGANIAEQIPPSYMRADKSVFAFFASMEEGTDEAILQILRSYVFNSSTEEANKQVISGGNVDGRTLIHDFTLQAMPWCVEALLRHGASANALEKKLQYFTDGGAMKKVWYESPLD